MCSALVDSWGMRELMLHNDCSAPSFRHPGENFCEVGATGWREHPRKIDRSRAQLTRSKSRKQRPHAVAVVSCAARPGAAAACNRFRHSPQRSPNHDISERVRLGGFPAQVRGIGCSQKPMCAAPLSGAHSVLWRSVRRMADPPSRGI